ncbi:tRNA pseudouridine(13) synthase TruD [Halalkalicoccus jeotgali]|uniref:Probable tRNA pseudouridine synthase D n=1 Tax=Halalkalicoccus jeotgali (strain DSM 18796 / CECT 7217 / JCM 14584 / KCTC 4019 / B3) TaxID=795797 RepID=D8J708_HALJB|nr:tRNA pseudouridine(13) synthase TruD [Halalkalicoccus jeotgali]ADJ15961.1 tRNA pseudouridine synthase D [Halalkalicoccus jeotgali B3]ELY38057.1 tRNA pseudouridine synthase D [Halalkalicoccus jeotgali B3]
MNEHLPAHPIEREVGMEFYASGSDGIGGRIRDRDGDFRVREIEDFPTEPVNADPAAYPHLVLRVTLRGWDTNDFARRLSDAMGASRERVSWAGTKDKRAVTTQLFSVMKGEPEALPEVRGADIEVVGRAGRDLQFGDLAGNEFRIRVRDADPENCDAITAALREFGGGRVGVPNYFGQQRFGSRRPVTHRVGLAIAREDWRGAVMEYLGNPRESEPEDTQAARGYVDREARRASKEGEEGSDPLDETEDWDGALERFPRKLGFERAMLHRLVEGGAESEADFRAALETAPTNLQRLFVNAAQSSLFNRILSERLERDLPFDRAVAGDVVCFADTDAPEGLARPDTSRTQRVTENRVETVNRHVERGRAFVTAPLVGTETELGEGEPGAIEREVLAEAGVTTTDFDLPGEFHSTGTRRAILLTTDLSVKRDPLTFDFALPSGSYATVLLREYLKCDPRDLG